MRVVINCEGGKSYSLMLLDHTTVLDVKQHVAKEEGVPVGQQLLLFGGRQLFPDSALLLADLGLDMYSMSQEVVIYMQRQLSEPIRVYLGSQQGRQLHPETVEASSTLSNIMQLLQLRNMANRPFPSQTAAKAGQPTGSSTVVVKRQDGSCCSRVRVAESCSLQQSMQEIESVEGFYPAHLSFYQAADGCLHIVAGPSEDPCTQTHTVYSRSCMPQAPMHVKAPGTSKCVPYADLVKELAAAP